MLEVAKDGRELVEALLRIHVADRTPNIRSTRTEERRLEALKANGYNAIRTSHSLPSPV